MIIGVVNTHTEATIRLPVRAADGRELEMEGVLDTGFNGSLTLSPGRGDWEPWAPVAYSRPDDASQWE